MIIWVVANLVGIASGVAHLSDGHALRGAFSVLAVIPNSFAIYLLHRTGRPEHAIHYLCACLTCVVAVSPLLSDDSVPILVGLFPLPLAATVAGGTRVGVIWTAVISAVLFSAAIVLPFEPGVGFLAWNVGIVTLATGAAFIVFERSRARLVDDLTEAREIAEKNVEERRRAEASLRESQAYFLESFRRAPSIFVLTERGGGIILDANDRFTEVFGYERDDVLGRTAAEIGIWQNPSDQEFVVGEVLAGRPVVDAEYPMVTRSGEVLWILMSQEPIDVMGRECALSQGVDITARKQQDVLKEQHQRTLEDGLEQRKQQLRASKEKLRESERLAAVGTLAAGVAHQINNPIGAISLAAESTLFELDDDTPGESRLARAREALQVALGESRRAGRIVKSLLKFAREEKTPQWVESLNDVVSRACASTRAYVEGRGGTLTFAPSPDSPRVLMSPIDIEQAVINLVRNAAESKPHGARVVVETRVLDQLAQVRVEDDGVGIPTEDRSRVLDPFYTTRLDDGGSGLGLSIVHGVAKDHRGSISIETPEAGGTRFLLTMPLVEIAENRSAHE